MEKTDNKLRVRPRFRKNVTDTPEMVSAKIKSALEYEDETCSGTIVKNYVVLKIPTSQQHYWSPQLTLELESIKNGTLIRGLYGPKPGVWTMFVFFYSSIGFLTLMGLIFGLSQMMLKMDPYGLWSVLIGGVLLIGLFVVSKIGQGLGMNQMLQLKDFLDNSLKD